MSIMTTKPAASNRLISHLQLHHHAHIKPCNNKPFFFNPLSHFPISNHKNRSLRYPISNGKREQSDNNSNMDFAIYCSSTDKQGDLISFGPFLNSWKAWILGGVLTVILPFVTNKLGPLLKWTTKNLEMVEEKVEEIAESVEKVGEEVEKVVEEMEEKLPDGGLKDAATQLENAAKELVKDADKVEALIDKVEDVEKKVDAIIEGEVNKSSSTAAAAKVNKPTA